MPEPQISVPQSLPQALPPWIAFAMRPLPLAPLQPALALMLARIGQSHPGLYDRLGDHAGKRFGIDPTDLPFAFVLEPRPRRPQARAVRRLPAGLDARIRGPFLGLVGMAEGTFDGDALFFSRTLAVEGDVEAVLALRNAMDDAQLDFAGLLGDGLGPFGRPLAEAVRRHVFARGPGARTWN